MRDDGGSAEAPTGEPAGLGEAERARIRSEMRYAMVVAQEGRPGAPDRSGLERALGVLSNGFVLLLLGSLITSGLVPYFQRTYEGRAQRARLMQECFSEFLQYSNSIWQEYYAMLPLTQQTDLGKEEYLRYLGQMAQIKLKRYEAYAKVQALALAFRDDGGLEPSPVEGALREYAIRLNAASTEMDTWLRSLYCTPTMRDASPCGAFDPEFDSYAQYQKIQTLIIEIGNQETDRVAALMVDRLKQR
jgi:hypothetical protein